MSEAAVLVSSQHATLPMISDNFESGDIEVNIFDNEWYYHSPCYSASRWWGDLSCISVWLHPETKWFWSFYYLCCDNTYHLNANVIRMISTMYEIQDKARIIQINSTRTCLKWCLEISNRSPSTDVNVSSYSSRTLNKLWRGISTENIWTSPTSSFNVYCGQWTMDRVCNTFCGLR